VIVVSVLVFLLRQIFSCARPISTAGQTFVIRQKIFKTLVFTYDPFSAALSNLQVLRVASNGRFSLWWKSFVDEGLGALAIRQALRTEVDGG
jgi:hypothetical protein